MQLFEKHSFLEEQRVLINDERRDLKLRRKR